MGDGNQAMERCLDPLKVNLDHHISLNKIYITIP